MKLKTILMLLNLFVVSLVEAQVTDYRTRIKYLHEAIDKKLSDRSNNLYYETTDSLKRENKDSWLWPLCAYIKAANEMEVLAPGKSYMLPVEKAIDQYYNDQPPYPAFQDYVFRERLSSRFYDDNQWIAIAYLDAYNRKHQKKYLDVSEMIARFMLGGLDTVAGGGIYWKEKDKSSKNTCSNGPAVLVLIQLYKITHKENYLRKALEIYRWTNDHLQSPEGLFYDNI